MSQTRLNVWGKFQRHYEPTFFCSFYTDIEWTSMAASWEDQKVQKQKVLFLYKCRKNNEMETQSVSVLFCVCSQQGGIRPSQKLKEICIAVSYANLHTGLWTIKLAIEVITSVSHKISLTLLQSVKSNSFFRNNTVVIGHSSSMWLTDRAIVQMHVTFCDTQMKVEIFAHCFVFRWICILYLASWSLVINCKITNFSEITLW